VATGYGSSTREPSYTMAKRANAYRLLVTDVALLLQPFS